MPTTENKGASFWCGYLVMVVVVVVGAPLGPQLELKIYEIKANQCKIIENQYKITDKSLKMNIKSLNIYGKSMKSMQNQ